MKLSELAVMLGSQVKSMKNDFEVSGISTLDAANANEITFVTEKKFLAGLDKTKAGAILLPQNLAPVDLPHIPLTDVWAGVLASLKTFYPGFDRKTYEGIHPSAIVDPTAHIAENVVIAPLAVIGPHAKIQSGVYIGPGAVVGASCEIGKDSVLYANCVLEADTILGSGVYLQPGAVLGADGFKYELMGGRWTKIPQVGHVRIGDNAEIGANSCVDRASYTVTTIGGNTKLDNLVQIGHNVQIGENCIIVSQSGVAGSSTIGDNTILAAQAGVSDNITVGNGVIIYSKSGVTNNVKDGEVRLGNPAITFRDEARILAVRKRLPRMATELNRLAKKVAELEQRLLKEEQ